MINKKPSLPSVIKPFNHTPASIIFRLACKIEVSGENTYVEDRAIKAVAALDKLKSYEVSMRERIRVRTSKVAGRRRTIERIIKNPFTNPNAGIVYKIAIETERVLEKHYQLKSGETYVLLSKAAKAMAEAIDGQFEAAPCPATLNRGVEA